MTSTGKRSAMRLETAHDGVILPIRAAAGAKRNAMSVDIDGAVKIFVTQIPEKGKANDAIRKQIAESLHLRASQVELIQGETSPQKRFLLRGIEAQTIAARLEEIRQG